MTRPRDSLPRSIYSHGIGHAKGSGKSLSYQPSGYATVTPDFPVPLGSGSALGDSVPGELALESSPNKTPHQSPVPHYGKHGHRNHGHSNHERRNHGHSNHEAVTEVCPETVTEVISTPTVSQRPTIEQQTARKSQRYPDKGNTVVTKVQETKYLAQYFLWYENANSRSLILSVHH